MNRKGDQMKRFVLRVIPVLFLSIFGFSLMANAQGVNNSELREGYLTPPESIAEEVLAPRHQNVSLSDNDISPHGEYFVNTIEASQMSPLSYYAKPYYNLAGLQIDHLGNRNRRMTTETTVGLELINSRTGRVTSIETPENARISDPTWSPDGASLAYFAHFEDATHIYVTNLGNEDDLQRVTNRPVLATLNTSIEWSEDARFIFTVILPENRGGEPVKPSTPNTIQVLKTTTDENRLRTYPSLLKNRNEADILEYYVTGQLVRIDLRNEEIRKIGKPAMIQTVNPSPDNDYLIVRSMQKPFSYIVPYYRFGWTEQIWDMDGNMVTELRTSEVDTGIPDHDEVTDQGREDIKWRPDGQGLSLIITPDDENEEDEYGGDNNNDEEADKEKDKEEKLYKIAQWLPPFGEDDLQILYETKDEMESVSYNEGADIYFVREDDDTEHIYAIFAGETDTTFTIYKHKEDDFYDDPGNLVYMPGSDGEIVYTTGDDSQVYLRGTQYHKNYSEEAPQPFLDRVPIRSGEKERVFQSSSDVYEEVTAILDRQASNLVIERQSSTMHPDFWLYDSASENRSKLTDNVDYNEAVTQARRDRFKVKRADGFEFWAEVTLPSDWDGTPLPGLIWHYPREYDDQEDYNEGIRDYNKNDFPGIYRRSTEILVKRGYAVIDADWPISAERGAPNEAFVWSIVQNSTAVIDSAANRGYIDRDRLAIGGHSYGAFGTANAMIHTSFFKAGIAGDGNYNRTLTPMGFQREPNDLWRGLDKYLEMSPIFWADRLDGALLMYHGEADQNVGTWPIHSKRMFHALNGIGKTAAMYMYPHEAHGPASEETMLDLWTRWSDWLDHYVKNNGDHVTEAELHSVEE